MRPLPRFQGYMSVESKALDDAFKGTGVSPRQRLLRASIDYAVGEVDCATAEFTDPDGIVAKAIRTAETKDGTKLVFVPWTVRIGYYGQEPDEMTKLVGVPQMEFPDFPETGDPIVRLKILNSSIVLKANSTPNGDPANYLEPLRMDGKKGPLRLSLDAVAAFYGLTPDYGTGDGSLEPVLEEIDKWIEAAHSAPQFNTDASDGVYDSDSGTWTYSPVPDADQFCRIRKVSGKDAVGTIETDYDWLRRVASIITSLIESGQLETARHYVEYFNPVQPGKVALSDIQVVTGVCADKLVFKCNYDFIMENGFDKGIPVLDYRNGNRLLRSFTPSADSSNVSAGFFATLFGNKRKQTGDVDSPPPMSDAEIRSEDDPAEINPYTVEKKLFFTSSGTETSSSTIAWIDDLRRHMATGISGQAMTFGIPKLIAGQLVGFAGLGSGPSAEAAEGSDAGDKQPFAHYSRLYFIDKATHTMDNTGLYGLALKVSASALDGSEKKVVQSFLSRLKKGVEFSASTGIMETLFGSTI